MAINPTFQSTLNQIASNGVDDATELASIKTVLGYVSDDPTAAIAWARDRHPELASVIDAVVGNPRIDFAGTQQLPASVTLPRLAPNAGAAPFAPALRAIHGPTINLTPAGASPIGEIEARAIANAVGYDRIGSFLAAATQPGFGLKLNLTAAGATELGVQAGNARVEPEARSAFAATLSPELKAAFESGSTATRGRRVTLQSH